MDASRIDEVILFVVGDRWTKVAKVITRVADAMTSDSPTGGIGFEVISEHFDGLVRAGRLEAWRNSKKSGVSARSAEPI